MLTHEQISRMWSDAHDDTSDRMAHQVLAHAVEAPLLAQIEEQLRSIQALNLAINGHGSTTTENLTLVGRLESRIAELESQLAAVANDSERYQWLTFDHPNQETRVALYAITSNLPIRGKGNTDEAIDAAIARTKDQP